MLRWMCRVSKLHGIRNERIRIKVEEISGKVQERRLDRCGHVVQREERYVRKTDMGVEIQGRMRIGRLKQKMVGQC